MLPTDHATLGALDAAADRLCEHAVGLEPVVASQHDAYVVMAALVALVAYEPPETLAERLELDLGRLRDGEPPVSATPPSDRRAGDAQAAVEGFLLSRGVAAERRGDGGRGLRRRRATAGRHLNRKRSRREGNLMTDLQHRELRARMEARMDASGRT